MIGLIHAYSSTNAGDGLLVDLSLARLARLGFATDEVYLVALDPGSFEGVVDRRGGVGVAGRGVSAALVPAAARSALLSVSALAGRPVGRVGDVLRSCEGLVAVGGGYLRAAGISSAAGTALNHLPQLLVAARSKKPTIYLPQGIGPLRGPVGRAVARALHSIDTVCVRDRWSAAELGSVPGLRRLPDLAVLALADTWGDVAPVSMVGRVGFVARRVPHASGYEEALRSVAAELGDRAVWAVQTAGDRTKSDAVHYERVGVDNGGMLSELLAAGELSIVVSVRLHGALMALRAGVPAIHLAYDRKGPAAFADLGLDPWCFDVRSITRETLADAIASVASDPRAYWSRLAARIPDLRRASTDLDEVMKVTLAGR